MKTFSKLSKVLVLSYAGLPALLQAQGLDPTFNCNPGCCLRAIALQPGNLVLTGPGWYSISRFSPNGSRDPFFPATPADQLGGSEGSGPLSIGVQLDGKVLVGGAFSAGGTIRGLVRYNQAATLESSFLTQFTNTSGAIAAIAVQPDNRILVGVLQQYIARLNSDGSLDPSFNPAVNGAVRTLALQPDGKILVGGQFTSLGGQPRNGVGRLNPDGSLDLQFNPATGSITALVLQPDGKIVYGTISGMGRLNADGTFDSSFHPNPNGAVYPNPNGSVYSIGLQADGQMIVGGSFTSLAGKACTNLALLSADGSNAVAFAAIPNNNAVWNVALQDDGKVLASSLGPLIRFTNTVPATQSVTLAGSTITWFRGGSCPEISRAIFDYSTNGQDWTFLGLGSYISGGWELNGVSVPASATLRARGLASGGQYNASSWWTEAATGPLVITSQPASRTNDAASATGFFVHAVGGSASMFQWRKNGFDLSDGGNISGAHTPNLSLTNVFGADAGDYSVVVSDSVATVTSTVAHLTVRDPLIRVQPYNWVVSAGQTNTFNVSAIGTAFSYQWRKDGSPLPGATGSALTLTNIQWSDRGNYDVLLSNQFGSVASTQAMLTVNLASPDSFDPSPGGRVHAMAFQTDGNIIVGGDFSQVGGVPRQKIARISADGVVDPSFNPGVSGVGSLSVSCVGIQPDGRILVGGKFTILGGASRLGLGRLETNGTVDAIFNPATATTRINALAVQPDGKILVGGSFNSMGGQPCTNVARLNPNGAIDPTFAVNPNGEVDSIAIQSDGNILLGGNFVMVAGQPRSRIARVSALGSVDDTFNPGASDSVYSLAVQPDGKVLVGGAFSILAGGPQQFLARLNSDGGLDPGFGAQANGVVESVALQADGSIVVAGSFSSIGGRSVSRFARLFPSGTNDPAFSPTAYYYFGAAVAIQPDGKIVAGGEFDFIGNQPRRNLARLLNPTPAIQRLAFGASFITWFRGGGSPEIWRAAFDVSTNGSDWLALGDGQRVPGGWQVSVPNPPTNALFRARGFVTGGLYNGSTWFVETISPFVAEKPLRIIADDGAFGVHSNQFGFNYSGTPGQVVVVEVSADLATWFPLTTNTMTVNPLSFNEPLTPVSSSRFYRLHGL